MRFDKWHIQTKKRWEGRKKGERKGKERKKDIVKVLLDWRFESRTSPIKQRTECCYQT